MNSADKQQQADTDQLRRWHRWHDYAQVIQALSGEPAELGAEQQLLLGLSYMMSGDAATGKPILAMAQNTVPDSLSWRSDLALASILQGDFNSAGTELESITADPSAYAVDFSRLAAVRLAQQREEESAELYREAIYREPGREHWYHNLAGVLVRMQRLEEALEQYELALGVAPDFHNSAEARRELLLALEQPEQVIEELEQKLQEEPAEYKIRIQLARALLRDNRFTDAIKCLVEGLDKLEDLLALKESDSEAYAEKREPQTALRLALADFWTRKSRHARSYDLLQKVERLQDEESADIRCAQANALIEMRRLEQATELVEDLVVQYPDNNRVKILHSLLLSEKGQYPQAEELLRKLLEIYPGNAAILCNLGQTLLWTGKLEESAHCFEQASRINPLALAQMVRTRRLPSSPEALEQMEKFYDQRRLFITDASLDVDQLVAQIERQRAECGVGVFLIDFLQAIPIPGRFPTRQAAIQYSSGRLRDCARHQT